LAEFEKLRIIIIDAGLLIGGLDLYSENINRNDTTDDDDRFWAKWIAKT
jgi:hypothetical protein